MGRVVVCFGLVWVFWGRQRGVYRRVAPVDCQSEYRVDYSSVYGNGEPELPYPFFVEVDLWEVGVVAEWLVYWGGFMVVGGWWGCWSA